MINHLIKYNLVTNNPKILCQFITVNLPKCKISMTYVSSAARSADIEECLNQMNQLFGDRSIDVRDLYT